MLTLNDGRAELWQWDTGRTLAVDADCSQVHFSNKVFGRSIDVDVVGGTAIIPDVLLQTDKDLNVWAFVGTAENGYTKISKTFTVNRRNKPADYVFTPTDQMTLQSIQRQIGDLADLTTEAKDNLVVAINEAAQTGGGGGSAAAYVLTLSTDEADAQVNSDAVTAAIAEHGHVVLKPGVYPFGSMVTIPDNATLDLGQSTILQTTYKSTTPLFCLNGVNATLKNGFLRGTYDKNDGDDGYEYFEKEVLVRVDACENGLIENVDAGYAWGVSLAFGTLVQDTGYVGSAANTSWSEHTSASLPIVEGYSYVMAYGQVGYNYIFSIAPVEYVFYDADGVKLKTVLEIPRIPVGIPSGASTFTIKTICPEFLAYNYGFTNVMPMLTVRDCYFHNNHNGGFCNSTHIITVENTKFAFMGTVDNTRTKSSRSTIYGIDIEDYASPFMRLSNCSFIKCPKAVMDGSTISQVDNCYGYDCDFGVYRGWYHIYNNLTANEFYVQGHNNEWKYPRVYLNGGKFNTAPVLHGNSDEYLFINGSEVTLIGANNNYTGGEFTPFTTYVKHSYNPSTFAFMSVLRNVALIDYSLASGGERRARMFPKKGSAHCVWKTPYLYEKIGADTLTAPYDIYGLTTDLPIYPNGFAFYDCVFKCRFTGSDINNGIIGTASVGTYEKCIIDCDGGGGSLFPYGNLAMARNVNLTFKNCVINNSSVPLLFGANTNKQSFAEGSKITFINCTVSNTEANGIIGNADLTNLTVAYTIGDEGGVVVDASLSVEGAAADAKAVGDSLAEKQPKGDYITQIDMTAYRTAEAQDVIDAGKQDTLIQSGASVGQIAKITAVDGTGKPTAWEAVDIPSGGGGERWRLVRTIKLKENVTAIDISEDNDGNPFALKKIRICGNTLGTSSGGQLRINVATNNDDRYSILGPYNNFKGLDTTKRWWFAESECFGIIEGKGKWLERYNTPDTSGVGVAYEGSGLRSPLLNSGQYLQDRVEFLHIFSNTNGVDFAAGSDIELWGVDA